MKETLPRHELKTEVLHLVLRFLIYSAAGHSLYNIVWAEDGAVLHGIE